IFGLPGFLSSRSFLGGESPLTIYGPVGIKQYVETSLKLSDTKLTYSIHYKEIAQSGILFEDDAFLVECIQLDHGVMSFGYRINQKDSLGRLHVEKLRALGINPGPIYKSIKENETTLLQDGTVIHRDDFLGEPKRGKSIVILGDTRYLP